MLESEKRGISRGFLTIGTILMFFAMIIWFLSEFLGFYYFLQSEILIPTAIVIIQASMTLDPSSSGKVYLFHANLLNAIGIISLPFHLNSSLFLIAGLLMAFFAYFVKGMPEARNTQFTWSNVLIAVGSYLVYSGNMWLGTPLQVVGIALTSFMLQNAKPVEVSEHSFDRVSFILTSLWVWGLSLSSFVWFIDSVYYSGFSFLLEGLFMLVMVGKINHGFWPISSPKIEKSM